MFTHIVKQEYMRHKEFLFVMLTGHECDEIVSESFLLLQIVMKRLVLNEIG